MSKRERISDKYPILGIVLKLLVLVILVPTTLGIFPFFFNAALTGGDDFNTADKVNMCAREYYERDYASLYEEVHLHHLYEEEFSMYREAAEATLAYENFLQWRRAKKNGFPESDEKIEYYYNGVLEYEKNCRNESNKDLLTEYATKAMALRAQDKELE